MHPGLTALLLAAVVATVPAAAATPARSAAPSDFDRTIGCQLKTQVSDISTGVYRCNVIKFLSAAPTLHHAGLINPQLSPQDVISHRYTLLGSLMVAGMMAAVHDLYADHAKVDHSVWTGVIDVPDGEGASTARNAVQFEFTRKAYAGIDWSKMRQTDLRARAKNFHFAPWFKQAVTAEAAPPGGPDER